MRKGFTMIELIFVIVILGILAAVAIPKLTATRDDAQVARGASNIATAVQDIGAYYTARGSFGNLQDMTNVEFDNDGNITSAANKVHFEDSTGQDCIGIYVSATDGNLTVTSESNSTSVCQGINTAVKDLVKVHQFGGSGVTW